MIAFCLGNVLVSVFCSSNFFYFVVDNNKWIDRYTLMYQWFNTAGDETIHSLAPSPLLKSYAHWKKLKERKKKAASMVNDSRVILFKKTEQCFFSLVFVSFIISSYSYSLSTCRFLCRKVKRFQKRKKKNTKTDTRCLLFWVDMQKNKKKLIPNFLILLFYFYSK